MKTIKVIDILVNIANGKEVPKKIKFDEHIYKYVNRTDELYNYKREDGKYLEEVWMITNILNSEVEIIEDTLKEERNINVCGTLFTKSEYDELAKSKEDKKIEKLEDNTAYDDYNVWEVWNKKEKILVSKINEIIDKVNGK